MSFTNSHSNEPPARHPPDGEGLVSVPDGNLGLFDAPTGSSTLEANPEYDQIEAWFALIQMGLQPKFPPPHEASTAESYGHTQPSGIGGHSTTQSFTEDQRSRNRTTDHGARPICVQCNKDFGRIREFERHLKEVHMPWRRCPFCDFMWARPDRIKAHIVTCHAETFTPEMLEGIKALSGQRVIEFIDAYYYVPTMEATSGSLNPS